MLKTSAIFSIHTLHVLLRNTLISFIVIFIALFFWLKLGIEADMLIIGDYQIEKLYLKLDKKLTIQADKILVSKKEIYPSIIKIDKIFDQSKLFSTFFSLHLKRTLESPAHIINK